VLAGHLFADPGFTVIGADAPQAAPQWGLFETAPGAAREKALAWQRHVREVECGLPGGPGSEGAVREQYDPEQHPLPQREQAKAKELTALGFGRVSADHPAPEDLLSIRQSRPHPLQLGFQVLHPHRLGLLPRFQHRPHRRHPPPPRHLGHQRTETSVPAANSCRTSGNRT
jgi:hypothetical protein